MMPNNYLVKTLIGGFTIWPDAMGIYVKEQNPCEDFNLTTSPKVISNI